MHTYMIHTASMLLGLDTSRVESAECRGIGLGQTGSDIYMTLLHEVSVIDSPSYSAYIVLFLLVMSSSVSESTDMDHDWLMEDLLILLMLCASILWLMMQ